MVRAGKDNCDAHKVSNRQSIAVTDWQRTREQKKKLVRLQYRTDPTERKKKRLLRHAISTQKRIVTVGYCKYNLANNYGSIQHRTPQTKRIWRFSAGGYYDVIEQK